MKTSILVAMLTLFCSVVAQAQDVIPDSEDQGSLIFESASFLNPDDCERLTIKCKFPENLTEFELSSADTQLAYSWGRLARPEKTFPMTLHARPGKVKISYRMKGDEWRSIHFDVAKGGDNTLTINGGPGVNLN